VKLVAYLRVSTDRQAEDGLGLDVQRDVIKRWARDHGHRIVAWYEDAGISGANGIDTRVGLIDALAALRDGRAAGLVVYRLDRLARDLIIQEQLLADLRRGGWPAWSTSASEAAYLEDDPGDPSRKLIRQVLGAVSEYERSMIALRLRSGRKRKADKGGFAYGSPPYGQRAEGRALVPHDDEQRTLARIGELRAEGASYREICTTLDTEGHVPRRGQHWQPATVRRIALRKES
jgi:DNA invertase Pin-like site-specific DNA recombinase